LPPSFGDHPVFSWFDADTCERFSASEKVFDLIDLSSRRTDVRSMFWRDSKGENQIKDLESIWLHLIKLAMFFDLRQEVLLETGRQEIALENLHYFLRFGLDLMRGTGDTKQIENISQFVATVLSGTQDAVFRGQFSRDELRLALTHLQAFSQSLTELRFSRWSYLQRAAELATDQQTQSAPLICRNDQKDCLRNPWVNPSASDPPATASEKYSSDQRPDWVTHAVVALQLRAMREAIDEAEAEPMTRSLGETQASIDSLRKEIADGAILWSTLAKILPNTGALQEALDSMHRTDERAFALGGLRRIVDLTIWQIAGRIALDDMGVKKAWAIEAQDLNAEIDRVFEQKTPADPITGLPFSLEKSEAGWALRGPSSHGLLGRTETCLRIHP
jgi:hypothetical protein